MSDYLTTDEKIDFIYKELHAQKRNRIIFFLFKLCIIGLMIYFYMLFLNNLNKDEIISGVSKNISKLVTPIVKDITNNMVEEVKNSTNQNNITDSLIKQLEKNSDLLNIIK